MFIFTVNAGRARVVSRASWRSRKGFACIGWLGFQSQRCVSGTAGLQGTNTQEVTVQSMFRDDSMYWSGRNGRYNMGKNSGNDGLIPGLEET